MAEWLYYLSDCELVVVTLQYSILVILPYQSSRGKLTKLN